MVRRRDMINSLALGGALSALAAPATIAAAAPNDAAQPTDRAIEEVITAVKAVRDEIVHQSSFWEIAGVRDQLRTFLRLNGKFPDYLEVGIDVWQQVYDWHVRFQQPITLGRTGDGRQTIALMTTVLVMRTDSAPGFIGMAYDNR